MPAGHEPMPALPGTALTVTNTGLTPVRGQDFHVPLAFQFPGRGVCDARIYHDPGSLRSGRQLPALPAATGDPGRRTGAGSGRSPGVVLGRELLHRNGAFTLLGCRDGQPRTAGRRRRRCPRGSGRRRP